MPTARGVAILLYPDVEVLDSAGPCEVFTTASRMALRLAPGGVVDAPLADGTTPGWLARQVDVVWTRDLG
ncbi:MAG: hypothetical protein V4795_25135 [Pseudomonadota bacterium]